MYGRKGVKKPANLVAAKKHPNGTMTSEPLCSKLAYNPDRRWEIWRLVTYAFMHANRGRPISVKLQLISFDFENNNFSTISLLQQVICYNNLLNVDLLSNLSETFT